MASYLTIPEAIAHDGLRLICAEGLPGPWAEGIRGILDVKRLPYVRGRFEVGADQSELIAWSAQSSVPVIAWNDEHPRSNWAEQLYLAERLQPEPRLVPEDAADRRAMFGYANELCGMHGFAWSRRLILVHAGLNDPAGTEDSKAFLAAFGAKYGYSPEAAEAASARVIGILDDLRELLVANQARGSKYFIGDGLTALDIYWAGMSHLVEPMAPDVNPMLDHFRPMYQNHDPDVARAAAGPLMDHREFVYREHLGVPLDL